MRLLLIIAALAALAPTATAAQDVDQRPRITVLGHGEVQTDPDRATINYQLRGEGPSSDAAVRAMVAVGNAVESALRTIDADAEPRTGDVSTEAVTSPDCKEGQYNSKLLSTGACAIVGYVATQNITMVTASVGEVGTMVGFASRFGARDPSLSSFSLSKPLASAALNRAIGQAVTEAEGQARELARQSNLSLGPIILITNGREFDPRRVQDLVITGSRRPQSNVSATPVSVGVRPQKITTSADVTLSYAIAR